MEYAEIVKKVQDIIVDKLGVEPSEDEKTANISTVKDAVDKVAEKLGASK